MVRPAGSDIPGEAMWRAGRLMLTAVIILVNLIGAAAVVVISLYVVPVPRVAGVGHLRAVSTVTAVAYIVVAVPVGALVGTRRLFAIRRWLRSGGPAGPDEQRLVLRAPLRLFAVQVVLWWAAAILFGTLTAVMARSAQVQYATTVGATVAITGLVTAACAYLGTERILRPPATRALADGTPDRLAVPGVATRAVLAWALGTGLPLVGLVAIGVQALAGVPVSASALARVIVVLGGVGLVVGLLAVVLAARATADPLDSLRRALSEVQRGRLDLQVPVYDGTQIGKLQGGFNRMVNGLAERERLRAAFGTYVDPDVAEHIMRDDGVLAGEQVEVTIMFIDVRSFTAFAESHAAPVVLAAINRLFDAVVPIIHDHGGRVDKFVGDGLLAVFGAPRRQSDHADRAVAAALAIERAVAGGRAGDLTIGIGVNSGVVMAGNVGGAGRLEYSVIGDPVNVAARVEAATRETGDTILIAGRTCELLRRPGVEMVERAGVTLKGKTAPVRLFAPRTSTGLPSSGLPSTGLPSTGLPDVT